MNRYPEYEPRAHLSAQAIFHPAVSPADRAALLHQRALFSSADPPDPPDPRAHGRHLSAVGLMATLVVLPAAYIGMFDLLWFLSGGMADVFAALARSIDHLGFGTINVLAFIAVAGGLPLAHHHAARRTQADTAGLTTRLRGQYILPDRDLDSAASVLLRRARAANESVTASQVYAHGPLDRAAHDATMPYVIWDLAEELAELTYQRRVLGSLAPQPGPATKAVLAPRTAALDQATTALKERVSALEAYSRQVAALDAACRDTATAHALASADPTLDLLSARTRDRFATADITRLTEAATDLVRQTYAPADEPFREPPARAS